MFCSNCGKQIIEGDKFCTGCGTPVFQEKLCPKCKSKLADGSVYCGQCGSKVEQTISQSYVSHTNPKVDYHFDPSMNQEANFHVNTGVGQNAGTTINFNTQQPRKYRMISKYEGEPTVGIAKATGTLNVYSDHMEYTKTMGNALGNLSIITMGVAARAEKERSGKIEIYNYQDIQSARVGKYAALMPAVVLFFNDGQVLSFNGTFTSKAAMDIVNTIMNFKKDEQINM